MRLEDFMKAPTTLFELIWNVIRLILRIFSYAVIGSCVLLYLCVGWVVGCEDHGWRARDDYAAAAARLPDSKVATFLVEFDRPETDPAFNSPQSDGIAFDAPVVVFNMTQYFHGYWGEAPKVCDTPEVWTDTSKQDWADRADNWHNRKSARLFRAYRTGYLNIAALHYTLTYLKHDQLYPGPLPGIRRNPPGLPTPFETKPYMSYCNATIANSKTLAEPYFSTWQKVSDSVRIPEAPEIEMRVSQRNTITRMHRMGLNAITRSATSITG
jgi:hypothetical protein